MSLRQRYRKILSGIIPVGAAGALLLLGSTAPVAADQGPAAALPRAAAAVPVSQRLAAIREAVSDVAGPSAGDGRREDRQQLAWWAWRNGGGGWRNGGGGAWRNGGGAWRNGGGAWRNGGGGWHNYWRNW
jgi:rSAM-associated Gly-rich repeat protein